MYQNAPCLRYADAFREIYEARVGESEKEALDASLVDSLSSASKLSELIDVWRMIGSECRSGEALTELGRYGENYKRLAEMPLKDMMKAKAVDVLCSLLGPYWRVLEVSWQGFACRHLF